MRVEQMIDHAGHVGDGNTFTGDTTKVATAGTINLHFAFAVDNPATSFDESLLTAGTPGGHLPVSLEILLLN
jgi:hypothetical protein